MGNALRKCSCCENQGSERKILLLFDPFGLIEEIPTHGIIKLNEYKQQSDDEEQKSSESEKEEEEEENQKDEESPFVNRSPTKSVKKEQEVKDDEPEKEKEDEVREQPSSWLFKYKNSPEPIDSAREQNDTLPSTGRNHEKPEGGYQEFKDESSDDEDDAPATKGQREVFSGEDFSSIAPVEPTNPTRQDDSAEQSHDQQ